MYLCYFPVYRCTANCSWCLQLLRPDIRNDKNYSDAVSAIKWLKNHKHLTSSLAISGGEATIHPDFKKIIEGLHKDFNITLTTNLFSGLYSDMEKFVKWAKKFHIRWNTSFHPNQGLSIETYIERVRKMISAGLSIGQVASVDTVELNNNLIKKLLNANIGWKLQYATGVGEYNNGFKRDIRGELLPKTPSHVRSWLPLQWADYSKYINGYDEYYKACGGKLKTVKCSTDRIIVGPDNHIYKCHSHAYWLRKKYSLGHIKNTNIQKVDVGKATTCPFYGGCEYCDFGHFKIDECKI